MTKRTIVLLFCSLCFGFSAFAQDLVVVRGRIADNETKAPIPGVNVFLRGEKRGTVSDSLGRFRLAVPTDKDLIVVFSHIAYQKTTRSVRFTKQEDVEYTIGLEPDTLKLRELVIWGTRPIKISESAKRRALFSVGEEEFEHLGEPDMDKALQYLMPTQVKSLEDRMTKPEDDFTLYVNGEWKESMTLGDISPYEVRRVMVWEMLGPVRNIDVHGRDAGYGKTVDVFPIGMPLRRGKYVISIETKK